MKILKRLFFFLLGLIVTLVVIVLVMAALQGDMMHVESSRTMNTSADKVFAEFNTLSNWDKWSAWKEADPTMKVTYSGAESGVGAKQSWTSKLEGGSLEITDVTPNEQVKYTMQFEGAPEPATGDFKLKSIGENKTVATWTMDSPQKSFGEKMFGVFMSFMVKSQFKKSLESMEKAAKG